jgi:hypothetical protein
MLRLHAFLLAVDAWCRRPAVGSFDRLPEAWRALEASKPFHDLQDAATRWTGHREALETFMGWLDELDHRPSSALSMQEDLVTMLTRTIRETLSSIPVAA